MVEHGSLAWTKLFATVCLTMQTLSDPEASNSYTLDAICPA